MNRTLDVTTAWLASAARGGAGLRVGKLGKRPAQLLELYEFEACPFCRKVREMLTYLDLEALIYPCPRGGTRFRPRAAEGGRQMFPYLVDPNTGTALYESNDIVRYLASHYGDGTVPVSLALGPVTNATSMLASAARARRGMVAQPSQAPDKPLHLWSFEASPYCRLVREKLCALELPYHLHNVAKGSPSRDAFIARSGKMMVPYLVDDNKGVAMFESAEIIRYLDENYAVKA